MQPLDGLLVLDFSQFLSGPSASLRMADLGARVIKVERTGVGDICRSLYISNLELDGDSTLFHSINRNKESISLDLKNSNDNKIVKKLIKKADVLIENFRPGVMERLGLGYEQVKTINPSIIYGEITGYGNEGPWKDKVGQDLLVQSLSGLTWLNGYDQDEPVPFGLAVVDMMAGAQLTQGILASLVRRGKTGDGSFVQVSLLEAIIDFQFEVLTTHLNDGGKHPEKSHVNNAHAYLGAPYGIYETKNGYIALAMGSIVELGKLLGSEKLTKFTDEKAWFGRRDEIKKILVDLLKNKTTQSWIDLLEPEDYWCSEVLTWEQLLEHEGFKVLDMIQNVSRENGTNLLTTRCPIRIDGEILKSSKGAPKIGEDTESILCEVMDEGRKE